MQFRGPTGDAASPQHRHHDGQSAESMMDEHGRMFVTAAPAEHRLALPGTEWSIWRRALLRTTGFPAAGLARLACPDLVAVADASSADADSGAFADAYAAAVGRISR